MDYRLLKIMSLGLLFLFIHIPSSIAQQDDLSPSFRFEVFDLPNNELGNHVQTIAQDSFGFIWFGSQYGLHRWDGYKFKTYLHDPLDANSISSSYIEHIHVAKDGSLWLGTWGAGINHFDPNTEIFTHYSYQENDNNSLSNNFVSDILEDRKGNLWIATQFGLNRFDPKSKTFKHFLTDANDDRSLSYNICSKLFLDADDILWVGTGWIWEEGNRGGLNRYHPKTEDFTRYTHNESNKNSLISNKVIEIFEDSKGNFWIGTDGDGLHLMDRKNGTFSQLKNTSDREGQLSSPQLYSASDWHTRFVFEDAEQKLWVGAWLGGIKYFDPINNEIQHYFDGHPKASLPDDFAWDMFQSKDGTLWGHTAGKNARVFKIIKESTFFNYIQIAPETHAQAFHMQENGDLWVGTYRTGLLKVNIDQNKLEIYNNNPTTTSSSIAETERFNVALPQLFDDIKKIESDNFGHLWLIKQYKKHAGLIKFSPKHGTVEHFFHRGNYKENEQNDSVEDLLKDEKGNLWILMSNGVLKRYISATNSFQTYTPPKNILAAENDRLLIKMTLGKGNKIWLCGGSRTSQITPPFLWEFDITRELFTKYDIDFRGSEMRYKKCIYNVEEDQEGNIWMITQHALRKMNPKSPVVEVFSSVHFGASNFRGFSIDEDNNIWLMGDGLVAFDPEKGTNFTYHSESGIRVLPSHLGAIYKGNDGQIFIGGQGGFQYFSPEKLKNYSVSTPPQVVITDFQLLDETYTQNGTKLFPNRLPEHTAIRLAHDEDVFTFSFAALNFLQPENNRHEYQLVGYDTNWRLTGLEPKATYIKVPPGAYTFQVRAANHEGVWGNTQSVELIILPPWWKTWWAYSSYVFLSLALLIGLYRFQVTRQVAKAEAKRLKELDAAKTQLYTNITHEFRTPLTVILGMAQQVKDNPRAHFRSGLDMIVRNGEDLLSLINQMLDLSKIEHGKMTLKWMQGDMVSYLRYLAESFHSFAENKDIQIHFLSDLEANTMDYDAEKIQQIIGNLLSNAVKFTPAGGNIYFSVGRKEQEQLWIKIKDTGKGIPDDKLPHIFDRFYQVDDSSTKESSGSGIGLSLTKELVHLMGGEIIVRSNLGRGTEFTVQLPIRNTAHYVQNNVPDQKPIHRRNSSNLLEESPLNQQATAELLLIEDNPDVVRYLSSCLADQYRLHIAHDGQEGIEIASKIVPDLIVSDVMMPKKDGFEVCKILKIEERTSHIPIIMLTAKADVDSKLEGLERGADAYLAKPFQKEELLVRIRKLLESRQQLQRHYLQAAGLQGGAKILKEIPKMEEVEDYFVQKVRKVVVDNLDNFDFSVEQLCKKIGMSNSQLHRKLSALTGYSATKFIRYIRLNHAKILLQNPNLSITAVAFDSGFSDPSYFGRVFKKEFGVTPMEWRDGEVVEV